jgi:hypothetical protein
MARRDQTHTVETMSQFLECRDPKDPAATAFYSMSWAEELTSGSTIATSTWRVSGVVREADSISDDLLSTTILISGGVDGQDYACENTVTTSDGETLVRTGTLKVRKR